MGGYLKMKYGIFKKEEYPMAKNTTQKEKTAYINFFAGVNPKSIAGLMGVIQQKLKDGVERFVILMSSGGGQVRSGISAYNFLRGIPAEVITHNYGDVTSVAVVVFCAGSKRMCVPNARFLLHGIGFDVEKARFDEKLLKERLKGLKIDRENIAKVIAANCNKTEDEVDKDMLEGITLNPQQAIDYGLVHEIKLELVEKGAELITIAEQ